MAVGWWHDKLSGKGHPTIWTLACGTWVPPPLRNFPSNVFWSKESSRSETMEDIRGNCHHFSLLGGSLKISLIPLFDILCADYWLWILHEGKYLNRLSTSPFPLIVRPLHYPVCVMGAFRHRAGWRRQSSRRGQCKRSKTLKKNFGFEEGKH